MAQGEVDLSAVWTSALNTVSDTMGAQQNAFLRLARLVGLIDNTVLLAVPNDFTKGVLEERLAAQLTDALSDELGRNLHLAITVDANLAAGISIPGPSFDTSAGPADVFQAADPTRDVVDLTAT